MKHTRQNRLLPCRQLAGSSTWLLRLSRGILLVFWVGSCARVAATTVADDKSPERPALIVAVERGQRQMVERLLKEGADVHVRTPDGVTPLYAAAFHGRADMLRLLIDAGAEVDGRAAGGRTALFTAAAEGQVRAVEVLLEAGADPNVRSNPHELAQTPLHMAAVEGQVETARRLLDRGAEVNAVNDRHDITPLYLAAIAGHEAMVALLRERGADPAIADIFGQTPSRAATVMAERETRRLLDATEKRLGFDPRAIIIMPYLGLGQDRRTYRGNRVAVVIGDGSLIATAAHCVADFAEAARQSTLAKPLLFSPYYGDVFEAEIVGVDPARDLAILRVQWGTHPAVQLAGTEELDQAKVMFVAGYPPPEKKEGIVRTPRQAWVEQLPILRAPGSGGHHQVVLGGARFVGPGWSGAPMILPGSGRLGGIFSRKDDLQIDNRLVLQNRLGASAQAIRELMNAKSLGMKEPPAEWKPIEGASEAFSAALRWLDAQAGLPPQEGVAAAEAFVERQPQSGLAHLLLAMSLSSVSRTSPGDPGTGKLVERQYREAVRLAPDSLLSHAAYGDYLEGQHRPEEALAELTAAERIERGNSFVLATRLKILAGLRPEEAEELGRRLTVEAPDNAPYWFHYAGVLRKLGRNDEAVRAAQASVRLAPKEQFWYRGRLADTLARCGRLVEAEACYRELLEQRPESAVFWLWYAQFLLERAPERDADLRNALEKCESLNHPPVVPQALLDDVRARMGASERK